MKGARRSREPEPFSVGGLSVHLIGEDVPGFRKNITVVHVGQPPRSVEGPVMHKRSDEVVYVLRGAGVGYIGRKKRAMRRGETLHVPAGVWHRFCAGPRGLEVICLFSPRFNVRSPDIVKRKAARLP